MKRDNDLIRELLLEFEASDDWDFVDPDGMRKSLDAKRRSYHVLLMSDAGLVTQIGNGTFRLTNAGHDFLDAARDDGIWQRTKAAVVASGGNATLEIVRQLAIGFLKKKITETTGFEL